MAGETDNDLIQALMQELPGFEGNIPFLYLDTVGKVTTGIGHMIRSAADAPAIPFVDRTTGAAADSAAIAAAYGQIQAAPKGLLAHAYEKYTSLNLPNGWAEQDAGDRLAQEFLPKVKTLYATYDTFPLTARVALLDMAYNLGIAGLREYQHLKAYCEGGHWTQAAQQCHRKGISDTRNNWTSQQFLAAATA